MGCAASLSAKYLPAPKVEEGTSQASSSDPQEAVPLLEPLPQGPKKWTRTEMGQFTEPQLVRWLESLKIDLSSAISGEHARMRLWEEIQNSRPEALEQVTSLADLEYWPLPEMLRWLEYFDALDAKVAPKDKLIAMLLDHAEELPPPNFGEDAEATFLTEVQRHVTLVKQAATTIILQLSEVLLEAEAQREKHPWYANGKALTDFKASELKGAEEMNIQFIELQAGEEVDITIHETSGWAWVVKDDQQGWVPATAVTELAVALQDYAADESESVQCKEGDQFEVILRHYSGWTLCRRPKDSEGTPSKDAEGWLPDNCLSDHPRNLATKQQRLIQSGLHRLAADLNEVERTLLRIRTEGAGEEDSLQALHAKVCGLAEEYRQIVAVLQANPQLLGQEAQEATDSTAVQDEAIEGLPGLPGLPPWVRVEAQCYYVSKTQKKLMSVTVKRVCEVRRQVLVTFNADQNARKIVDFEAFEDMSNCPLQPKEKSHRKGRKRHAKNANANAEANLAEELRGLMQVLGPADDLSAPLSQSSDSESSYESDYTESTTSGGFERRASGCSAEQVSGSTVSLGLAPEGTMGANFSTSAMAEARRERAARQIQAAYRRFRTVSHPKESRGSSKELSKPPLAPLSPDRRAGAVCLVQSVLRGYLAKEGLQLLRWEAAAERQQAAQSIVAVMQRFQVQMDMLAFASLCRSVQMLQGAFRSHQCRLLLCTLASEQMLQRQAAALTLQTAQRGRAARRELARRRARRDGLLLLSPGKHRAIRQIQRCGLRYLACCVLPEAERCRWCKARTIQANWRGHRCRRQWEDEMFKWRQSRQQAASRLQSMVRAVDAKKQLRQGTLMRSAAAQWIQTAWRRHRAVRRCSELRQKQRQLAAGLRIQSHWRGHVSRKSTTPILRRRQVAASRLQGMLRMARAREEVLRLREERQLTEFVAVTKIQSLMRSYQARKEVTPQLQERRRQHWASVKVQSSWRRQMAKAEAMKRRAQDVNQLLSSLLEGRPDETLRGDAWLQKVTAAFEWKTQRDVELEEKELRLRRQSAFSHLPSASFEELSRPESLSAAALLDRSMAAVCVAKQRARQRMKALLQTQAHGNKGLQSLIYDNEMCRSLAVDHGVLIRLNAEDGVAEVGNLLQTAWSIAFQLRSAAPIGGASPALHVLTSGIHSLKRKLRIEIQGAGKVEDSAALKSFMETAEEACNEAVHRATEARNATLQPLKEELEAALAESQVALKDLNGHISKVLPEVNAIKAKYKEDAVEAEAKLREEREMKHAQTVALNKIAICTQIEKERLEAGLVDKNKPKIACYKKVFANVKELQHELKDLEVSGTANRKSQGILQHTLRALESRAQKAENDSKGKVLFGDAEEDLKDFTPSEKVAQKQERGEEQELQFREALESEVQSLHADMEARAKFEAGTLAAQLRAEAEDSGEAASRALARLVAWREAADPRRQWLAEVVPIARSCAQIRAAAEFIKVCKTPPEPPHSLGAALSAVQKQLGTLESQAERAASGAESPREGQLPQVFQKLQNALKALAELKVTYPDMPRSPHRNSPMAFLERKLYGREEEADAEATAEASEAEGSRSMSVSGAPPPFAPEEEKGATGSLKEIHIKDMTEATEDEVPFIPSPATGSPGLTGARAFNLMFETYVGPYADGASKSYLRPETAQGIFVNFKQVAYVMRQKIPFGIAQIGKAFRNEITPRQFLFRSREFEQMEIEYFIDPEADFKAIQEDWIMEMWNFLKAVGVNESLLDRQVHEGDKLAHYARACTDIVFRYPFGTQELLGVAARGEYDLQQHAKASGESLEYQVPGQKRKFVPHVIEPSLGIDRLFLALLCSAYDEDEIDGDKRSVLRFHPCVAPITCAIFPLLKNKPPLVNKAKGLASMLRTRGFNVLYDEAGTIGKRYRRMDEVGTPFCCTIDFDTLEDDTVTVRKRDDPMTVERMRRDEIGDFLEKECRLPMSC